MLLLTHILEPHYDVVFGLDDGAKLGRAINDVIRWSLNWRDVDQARAKNDELCDIEIIRLDTHLIVSVLRSTFHIRQVLECWVDKVDDAETILTTRGIDPRKILRGLKRFENDR